jgi:hypothetical protein
MSAQLHIAARRAMGLPRGVDGERKAIIESEDWDGPTLRICEYGKCLRKLRGTVKLIALAAMPRSLSGVQMKPTLRKHIAVRCGGALKSPRS